MALVDVPVDVPTCPQSLGLPVHSENKFPVERRETWHRTLHLLLWGRDRPQLTPQGMDPSIKSRIINSLEKGSEKTLGSDLEI